MITLLSVLVCIPSLVPRARPVSPRALILPHHDVVIDLFPTFYTSIPENVRTAVTTLYVLSPNHYHPEDMHVIMKDFDQTLETIGVIHDESRFPQEHGVNLHLPFIARYFPHAKVVPLLFTRYVSRQELDAVLHHLQDRESDSSVFFLASIDFSHDLTYSQSTKKDAQTLNIIRGKDPSEVLSLSDAYLDCPACLYLIQSLRNKQMASPTLVFHGNSAKYLHLSSDARTTSYFVIAW